MVTADGSNKGFFLFVFVDGFQAIGILLFNSCVMAKGEKRITHWLKWTKPVVEGGLAPRRTWC